MEFKFQKNIKIFMSLPKQPYLTTFKF